MDEFIEQYRNEQVYPIARLSCVQIDLIVAPPHAPIERPSPSSGGAGLPSFIAFLMPFSPMIHSLYGEQGAVSLNIVVRKGIHGYIT